MSQSIGTNVVADGNDVYQLLNGLLNALNKLFEDKKNDKYKEMIESLAKYVGNGGQLSYTLIDQKFVKDIESLLQNKKIDYMLLPSDNGNMGIAVKDKDKEAFLDIQEKVYSLSTDYAVEVDNYENFLDNVKTNPACKNLKTAVLSFDSNADRLLCRQALYENGIVSSFDDTTNNLAVAPNRLFNKNGDLTDALLQTASDLAKYNLDDEYKTIKQNQLEYDRDTLNRFIDNIKNEKACFLCSISNSNSIALEITSNGDIVLHDGNKTKPLDINLNAGRSAIFATLSRFAVDIKDMTVLDNKNYKTILYGSDEDKKKLIGDLETAGRRRPKHAEGSMGDDIEKDGMINEMLNAVKAQATKEIMTRRAFNTMTQEQLCNLKRERIIDILKNEDNSLIKDFLSSETKHVIPADKRRDFLKDICNKIDDVVGNSKNDIGIRFEKASVLQEEYEARKGKENKYEQKRELDRENPASER